MAQVDCAGPLQLLRGTGKSRQSRRIPGSVNWAVVAHPSPPQPETSDLLDAYARLGRPMVSSTASAPSLPGGSLCRQSSAIRTGCANERPSGSEEGVASNHDPYSDLINLRWRLSLPLSYCIAIQFRDRVHLGGR